MSLKANDHSVAELAEGCSTQARVANRTWLGVLAVSVVLLVPPAPVEPGGQQTVDLPLLPGVPIAQFLPIGFALLCILVIALAAAHAEHVRADALAHAMISELPAEEQSDARALLDILRVPGLTRVAPLALWARGGWQQDGQEWLRTFRRITGGILYVILKVVVVIVLFVVPGLALWQSYDRVQKAPIPSQVNWGLGVLMWIAIFSLSLVGLADLANTRARVRKFFQRDVNAGG